MNEDNKNVLSEEQSKAFAMQQLSSAQTLATISIIAAPVSLIIGGLPLGIVALICGLVALSKVRSAMRVDEANAIAANLQRQVTLGIAVSAISLVLNAVSLILIMPAFIEYMQTGDLDKLVSSLGNTASTSSSASTSVWD